MHALLMRDAKMLEAVLDEYADNMEWPFHGEYEGTKDELSECEVVRVVNNSRFNSIVLHSKRFRDLHAMELT
jgi:hypothetical protein